MTRNGRYKNPEGHPTVRTLHLPPPLCSISCIIPENAPRWSSSFLSPLFCIECFLPPSYDPPTRADKLMADNYPQDDLLPLLTPPIFSSYSVAGITEERGGVVYFPDDSLICIRREKPFARLKLDAP